MKRKVLRIGTRDSQLAVWQATLVKKLLAENGYEAELVYIKSEGDIDLQTPLYEMGVQGVFTRSLDIALLSDRIDLAVHSMKDVPTQMAKGIAQAAVLKRASYKDLLVFKSNADEIKDALGYVNGQWTSGNSEWSIVNGEWSMVNEQIRNDDPSSLSDNTSSPFTTHHSPLSNPSSPFTTHHSPFTINPSLITHNSSFIIATSSIRRKAQWLHRYPNHTIENLRGNVNTRLRKVEESDWNGAIFAAAGLERIDLRPENSIELDWMLPAPAQGAIVVVCKENDDFTLNACSSFNHESTAICTKIEKDFLRTLLGGCSTPISALAEIKNGMLIFKGNILSVDGSNIASVEKSVSVEKANDVGVIAANELLANGGQAIANGINNEK